MIEGKKLWFYMGIPVDSLTPDQARMALDSIKNPNEFMRPVDAEVVAKLRDRASETPIQTMTRCLEEMLKKYLKMSGLSIDQVEFVYGREEDKSVVYIRQRKDDA